MAIPTLHTRKLLPRAWLNRVFAFLYTIAILSLFYHHFLNLIHSANTLITISLILADLVLSFMWITYQAFHLNPIRRCVFPENLPLVAKESEYPALDVFICTADPFKEPSIGVVNTALSVLAYDYPVEKLSVYVSDDGGSQLTLFAFMEAAKFAKHWLPYCKKNNIVDRCPEVYFASNDHAWLPETKEIKLLYERMKERVEKVVEKGSVSPDYISGKDNGKTFSKWANKFTRHDHPTIIQVLLESTEEKDVDDNPMPNLIYLSREKSKDKPHNFKAGALNALLRVSATMTNAPIFLVLDCDMYSNDPTTPLRALCYFLDPYMDSKLAFLHFPQRFHGINENDIYSGEFKIATQLDALGSDGLLGPIFMGTGAFFRRLVLFGPPGSVFPSEIRHGIAMKPESKSIRSKEKLELSHHVAGCNYEDNTKWGSEMGFRYGCVIEDMFTSYHLHCQGWKSILCNPKRAAFLGNSPITLDDLLSQTKRWFMGFLELSLSKYFPITFGIRFMNPLQALCYAHYLFWPFWSIPITIYGFLPQLALINSFPIFPKVSDPWFFLYAFLFLGAYGKNLFDFTIDGGPIFRRWWNSQRMWLIWGLSSFLFALPEYLLEFLGLTTFGFNVTSKADDKEQRKRYEQGMFEFGVSSPMFLTIATAATINLFSFVRGITQVFKNGRIEELFVQIFIAGFAVVNSWPVYEAMFLRSDPGKMPLRVTLASTALAWVFFMASSLAF